MSESGPKALQKEGLALFGSGRYEEALEKLDAAKERFAAEGDDNGQAETLNAIGVTHRQRRKPEEAVAALQEAGAIFMRLGEHNKRGQVVGNLADVFASMREQEKAARGYSDAAAIFGKEGDSGKQSQVLRALSLLRLRQGRLMVAMVHMEESLDVRPRISIPQRLFRGLLRFALRLVSGG